MSHWCIPNATLIGLFLLESLENRACIYDSRSDAHVGARRSYVVFDRCDGTASLFRTGGCADSCLLPVVSSQWLLAQTNTSHTHNDQLTVRQSREAQRDIVTQVDCTHDAHACPHVYASACTHVSISIHVYASMHT